MASAVLNKLTKWRGVFASWQLGSRLANDPECQAIRDHREVTIVLRAEVTALTGMLIKKGVFTAEEYTDALDAEAVLLDKDYEQRFVGISTSEIGVHIDIEKVVKAGTMKDWKP